MDVAEIQGKNNPPSLPPSPPLPSQAFSLVFVSEIGDKTFFIAGLLAMKTSRLISFTGSMAALSVMTIISVLIGQVFHAIPSGLAGGFKFDQWVAVIAFSYFGLKTLKVGRREGREAYI